MAGALALPLGVVGRSALIVVLLWHARLHLRGASRTQTIVATADGHWALPDRQQTLLRLSGSTRYADGWIDLRLHGDRGDIVILLLRDQLGGEDWCRLQARLRRERHGANLA